MHSSLYGSKACDTTRFIHSPTTQARARPSHSMRSRARPHREVVARGATFPTSSRSRHPIMTNDSNAAANTEVSAHTDILVPIKWLARQARSAFDPGSIGWLRPSIRRAAQGFRRRILPQGMECASGIFPNGACPPKATAESRRPPACS